MSPKEYLSQIEDLNMEIRQREYERRELLSFDGVSAVDFSKISVTGGLKGGASFVRRYEQLEALDAKINTLHARKDFIIGQIRSLDNPRYSNILFRRYVEGERLDVIARAMQYSYHRMRHLHGYALKSFGQKFFDFLKVDT